MSWRSHPVVIGIRSLGRRLGLNRLLASIGKSSSYEDRFRRELLSSIRSGDCVWDVGANVGFYTTRMANLVGQEGCVVAFEPSPANLASLSEAVSTWENVVISPLALGDSETTVRLREGEDRLGATSRVVESRSDPSQSTEGFTHVEMARGDELVQSDRACHPNIVKIDTEGYELDVLKGLSGILRSPSLRTVGVEVHFSLLEDRGLRNAPAAIERLLGDAGLSCNWLDSSHIVATRENIEADSPASN